MIKQTAVINFLCICHTLLSTAPYVIKLNADNFNICLKNDHYKICMLIKQDFKSGERNYKIMSFASEAFWMVGELC